METLRSLFAKPDPNAQVRPPVAHPSPGPQLTLPPQMRKCNTLLRSNMRKIDRDISALKQTELKTKNLILAADRRGQRVPSQQKQAQKEVRDFARLMLRTRREGQRLVTAKAQLSSVQMQVNEAFALRKIEGSIKASVGVMKDLNTLVSLPGLAMTMRDLSVELMKAGVIEEMVGEVLPVDGEGEWEEEEEAEGEVDKVLGEILKDKMEKAGQVMPSVPTQPQKGKEEAVEEEEEEDTEAMMDQIRNRLEALRS